MPAELRGAVALTGLGELELRGGGGRPATALVMLRPEQLEVSAAEGVGRDLRASSRSAATTATTRCCRSGPTHSGELLLARVHGEQALPSGTAVRVSARGPVSAVPEPVRVAFAASAPGPCLPVLPPRWRAAGCGSSQPAQDRKRGRRRATGSARRSTGSSRPSADSSSTTNSAVAAATRWTERG